MVTKKGTPSIEDRDEVSRNSKEASKPTAPQRTPRRFEVNLSPNKLFNKGLVYVIIGLCFLPFILAQFGGGRNDQVSLSTLINDIRQQNVERLEVAGQDVTAFYKDGTEKIARKEDGQQVLQVLEAADIDLSQVNVEVKNVTFTDLLWQLAINILPIILMLVFFFFLFRQARGAQDGLMGIGRSKAKVFVKGKQDVKFADVGGMKEAKQELEEIVDFLKNPKKYKRLGARTPKGVLLVGPAGTGKTLLARAVAGEANVQFLSIAGSEFMEMLVGVGASRVRDLFSTAKKLAPSIIFIDEIDAIGRMRGHGSFGGHDEREQTLNQILVEMDGFTPSDNVAVIAATNRGDLLDPALLRPGRFDRRVVLDMPDKDGRLPILKIHARGKRFSKNINWERIADRTVGFSGADLENMLNEAAIQAAREDRDAIEMSDIEEAATKVKLGPAKKRLQSEEDKKITAYHEAGHAIVTHFLLKTDPVQRISIVARGMSLGHTLIPPAHDRTHETRSRLLDQISAMLGGRAAEEVVFNEMTAGASNDIEHATAVARAMVTDFGMSSLGPINLGFQGDETQSTPWESGEISESMKEAVDREIQKIIDEARKKAIDIVKKHRKYLDKVAEELLDKETLDQDDFEKIVGKKKNGGEN